MDDEEVDTPIIRAMRASDELAAAIRALQTAGASKALIRETIGVNRFTLNALLADWGLDK